MEKTAKYLILSIGMGIGAYLPTIFGAGSFGGWSIIGTMLGGIASVVVIYKLSN
jgi:hypothetical protein